MRQSPTTSHAGLLLAGAFFGETIGIDMLLGAGLILAAAGLAATKGRTA